MSDDPYGLMAAKYSRPDFAHDVGAWAAHRLGVHLYSLQRDITKDILHHNRVFVRSCHDSGKTFMAAVSACHWIDTHPIGEARVVSTAPSNTQVRGLLWNEINGLHARAEARGEPLPGRVNQTEWWIGTYMAGIGRKPSDYKPEQFSGFHARYPLIIMDEADGLPKSMWNAVDTLLTNINAHLFAIGNPDDPASEFRNMQDMAGALNYIVHKISAWDTPNFSGEEVPQLLKEVLLSEMWVRERRGKWGGAHALLQPIDAPVDHPFWASKVEAEYPDEDELTIIRAADMTNCMLPEEDEKGLPIPVRGPVALGVDVAGSENGDETVIRERIGKWAMREWRIQSGDPDIVSEFIIDKAILSGCTTLTIDVTGGWGWGFVGILRKRLRNVAIVEFNFGSGSDDKDHYKNKRAELYWRGREMARDRSWCWAYAENAEETVAQLTSCRKLPGGKVIQVEDKDLIKKRIGRSPDNGDAALLAFWKSSAGGPARVSSAAGRTIPTGASAVSSRGNGSLFPTGAAGVTRH